MIDAMREGFSRANTLVGRSATLKLRLEQQRSAVEYHMVPQAKSPREEHWGDANIPLGQRVLESHTFTNVMAIIILTNGVIIGLETDYTSFKYWSLVEASFLCIFLAEVILKMWVEGWLFFHPHEDDFLWNLFDVVVVGLALFDFVSSAIGLQASSGGFATIFRMARLLRVLRIIRLLKVLKPLVLLAFGLQEACKAIIWVTLLMGTVLYVLSIVLVKTVGQVPQTDPHYEFLIQHFHNIPSSMITLFILMSSPNLPLYQDEDGLLETRPFFCVFLIMFICVGSFGMIAMLTGVINESMFDNNEMRKQEKKMEHESMRLTLGKRAADLYEKLPLDDRGCARVSDLTDISEDAAELLDQSGITIAHGDIIRFLELMDDNETGYIDLIEFVHAIEKMAEGVSPLAMIEVQHHAALCNKKVSAQLESMRQIEEKLESQMAKTELEVNKILCDLTSVQHKHRENLIEKIETQMVHITDEVDRMLKVVTSEQNDHRGHLIEKIESQMLRTSEEVDRILKVLTSNECQSKGSEVQSKAFATAPSAWIGSEGISKVFATAPPAWTCSEGQSKVFAPPMSARSQLASAAAAWTGSEGQSKVFAPPMSARSPLASARSFSPVSAMGETPRDVQVVAEVRRCENTVISQASKQSERMASSVQHVIERKFSDLERQRAMKESSDKCVQLALSNQLQDISASLHKLLHEAGPQPKSPTPDQKRKEEAMESLRHCLTRREEAIENLRSDLATLTATLMRVNTTQDTVKENVDLLTSKVSMLEREADSLQSQVVGSVAALGGDIIASLTELLSKSMGKFKQDSRLPREDSFRLDYDKSRYG